ncbi:PaaI family thioesterase [bacterium]|nr:PaaI family thioesterase [bacterium]
MPELNLADDSMCFACGRENPDGLHMEFTNTESGISTTVTFDKKFQGYRNVVHGGLLSTVLDETMVTLLNRMGVLAFTAELTVRFLSPVLVGEPLTVTARLIEARRKVYRVEAEAVRGDEVVARSHARFMAVHATPSAKRS